MPMTQHAWGVPVKRRRKAREGRVPPNLISPSRRPPVLRPASALSRVVLPLPEGLSASEAGGSGQLGLGPLA